VGVDVVVLDAGQFGREHAEAAGGHGGGEGDHARLVHAEVVDAVEDDDAGRIGVELRRVEAGANGSAGQRQRDDLALDGLEGDVAQQRRHLLVGDEIEHGERLQMRLDEGPRQCDEKDKAEDDDAGDDAGAIAKSETATLDDIATEAEPAGKSRNTRVRAAWRSWGHGLQCL
jgi:hypothetical protein